MTTTLTLAQNTAARIKTLPADKITIFEGYVPSTPAAAYIAYYPDGGATRSDRHSDSQQVLDWTARFVCVGRDVLQCLWVVDQLRAKFYGWSPDGSGPASMFVEVPLGNNVLPDTTVPSDIRYSFTLQYTLTTTRS